MHDVQCDDIHEVLDWAEAFLATSELTPGTRYFVAIRSRHAADTDGDRSGVSLTWITPPPETAFQSPHPAPRVRSMRLYRYGQHGLGVRR
ncbi:hypothetical protein DEO23_08675 [Brachybacterium endophyticum]|uniref:Uncharacterized protein n=1 Tax=Brachybacterium endophyticum TaxID=2182385 RepID=A0A2U2RMD1_9MICO|nr:hypothetical protein DEO23_08675 [Brachybacterium endophyticum]